MFGFFAAGLDNAGTLGWALGGGLPAGLREMGILPAISLSDPFCRWLRLFAVFEPRCDFGLKLAADP